MNEQSKIENFETFEVDLNLVNTLIHAQNGTIPTSLRELIMNAFDAQSRQVDIKVYQTGFSIDDDGCGFGSEENIRNNFKRFGSKHETTATHGRFRVGRGQIMAFAKTSWHSNNHKMTVDIVNNGNGYIFENNAPSRNGCLVSGLFYQPISDSEVRHTCDELEKLVRFAEIPVFINGVHANRIRNYQWTIETEQYKICLKPEGVNGIFLYSQGVFVKELARYHYGDSAIIVTKQALQLNIARNDINQADPLWLEIHNYLHENLKQKVERQESFLEEDRHALIYQFYVGHLSILDIYSAPILTDVRGRRTSFAAQLNKSRPWAVLRDATKRQMAESIVTRGQAFIMTEQELNNFGVESLEALIALAKESLAIVPAKKYWFSSKFPQILDAVNIAAFDELAVGLSAENTLLDTKLLKPTELAGLRALQYVSNTIYKHISKLTDSTVAKRKVFIGDSDTALAWTDAQTYIAIERRVLSWFNHKNSGFTQLILLLLHEYSHTTNNIVLHEHGFDFYELFHDLATTFQRSDIVGGCSASLKHQYLLQLANLYQKMPAWYDPSCDGNDIRQLSFTFDNEKKSNPFRWIFSVAGIPLWSFRGSKSDFLYVFNPDRSGQLRIKFVRGLCELAQKRNISFGFNFTVEHYRRSGIDETLAINLFTKAIFKIISEDIPSTTTITAAAIANWLFFTKGSRKNINGLSMFTQYDDFALSAISERRFSS